MPKHTKPWGAVLMAGVVATWVGLWVMPAVAKRLEPVERTGQTQCWDVDGFSIGCDDTEQDGDIQAGVPFPEPRFIDNDDGTVTDNLTGLIWLKDAGCLGRSGRLTWGEALAAVAAVAAVAALASGSCDLTDQSRPGHWRLPNIKELQSLIHFGFATPAPSNAKGTGQWTDGDAFSHVGQPAYFYWSSTTQEDEPDTLLHEPSKAWGVDLDDGTTLPHFKENGICGRQTPGFNAWPVRGPVRGGQFAPAPVEVTGQTQCWDPTDTICRLSRFIGEISYARPILPLQISSCTHSQKSLA